MVHLGSYRSYRHFTRAPHTHALSAKLSLPPQCGVERLPATPAWLDIANCRFERLDAAYQLGISNISNVIAAPKSTDLSMTRRACRRVCSRISLSFICSIPESMLRVPR